MPTTFEEGKTYFRETFVRKNEPRIRKYLVNKRTRCFITFDGFHKMKVRKDEKDNEYVDMITTTPVSSVNLIK